MKKVLVLLFAIIISAETAFAAVCGLECPSNPYASGISFSNLTGTNFFAEKVADILLKKRILEKSKGKYRVNLQSYNVGALKRGEFKSLEITGRDTVTEGIYASYIRLETLCDYNHIEINNKMNTAEFKENFGMVYTIQFTEDDLNKTMRNSGYMELIRRVNRIGNSSKLFNIVSSSAEILDNKLVYVMKVSIPFFKVKQDIAVETDMKVRAGEIVIDDAQLKTEFFKVDIDKIANLINYLNPLDFSMKLLKNKDVNMQVKKITIEDNTINVSGIVTVEKDVITAQ